MTCPKKDNSRYALWRALPAFRGIPHPPEARSLTVAQGNRPAARFTLRQEWTLFFVCVGLDALVLYALMAAAERWAR